MAINPRRKSDAARRANQVIRSRTVLVMLLLGVCTFLVLFWKLYDLQIVQHDKLQEQAVAQQTRRTVVNASRGTIYDKNHNVLAISATAETVFLSPLEVKEFVESQEEKIREEEEKAAEKKEKYTPPEIRDGDYIARGLSRILAVDEGVILEKLEKTYSQYEIVKLRVEQTTADEVRRFITGELDDHGEMQPEGSRVALRGIYMEPDSKRYYPYSSLAANVIGFVNSENQGGVGLEAKYEDVLEGTSGMTVTAKNARNTDLLYRYEKYYDAENGSSLVLTLDTDVQHALEKGLESMLDTFDAKNGGTGIVLDVNTGGIVAMASYPNYDLQQFGTVYDETLNEHLQASLAKLEETRDSFASEEDYQKARAKAVNDAVNTQWRNKCIDSTYEPGSTFKPITLAAALEEGVVNLNSTFNCTGSTKVGIWTMGCSKKSGHGQQTLEVAVGNSCNPAFINIGQRVGAETYYKYMKAFGLTEPTGVDMIGETKGIVSEEGLKTDVAALASYSFGQTFNVTPLELIRAQAACINGGYLYTPYVVDQVLDDDGNIIRQQDTTPVRQVISEETSATVRQCLEYVVANGTGKNGQVVGYNIGGKTGTADKTGTKTDDNPKGDVVVSFMCFAPAEKPQYIMLLTMDTPSRNTDVYVSGGNMVAPTASKIMAEILPILGVEPDYTADELAGADAPVPNVAGMEKAAAAAKLESAGFAFKAVGTGATVTDQTPAGGAIVPNNATVILYLGEQKPSDLCVMPSVIGMTAAEANKAITNAGLIMKVAGATSSTSGNVRAISQSQGEGARLAAGTVVTVQFGDSSVLD